MDSTYSNEYARDTLKDTLKDDPLRVLDLGNDIQLLANKAGIGASEKERADSSFKAIVEESYRRPFSHTAFEAATQALPLVVSLLGHGLYRGIKAKTPAKAAAKAGKQAPVKKIVSEFEPRYASKRAAVQGADPNRAEALKALDKGAEAAKLYGYPKEATEEAVRRGINSRIEAGNRQVKKGTQAFQRVYHSIDDVDDSLLKAVRNRNDKEVDKKLRTLLRDTDVDIEDVRKRLYSATSMKLDKDKVRADTYAQIDGALREGYYDESFARQLKEEIDRSLLGDTYMKSSVAAVLDDIAFGLGDGDTMLYSYTMMKPNDVYKNPFIGKRGAEIAKGALAPSKASAGLLLTDTANALINSAIDPKHIAAREMRPKYYSRGAQSTPILDFIRGMVSLDLNDPARYNEEDIEGYWKLLQEHKIVDPDLNLSPRQKIQVIKELNRETDREYNMPAPEGREEIPMRDYVRHLYKMSKESKR